MDLALKQRLVGAVVIVTLGVVFIPMLLDGRDDPADAELEMTIPEPPAGRYETRRLALDPDRAEREAPPPQRAPLPRSEEVRPVREVVVETPAPADAEPLPPPRTDDRVARQVREAPTGAPAAEPAEASAEEPPASNGGDADPEAALPAPAGDAAGEWVLQLGSFSRRANAQGLVERAREAGYRAWTNAVTVGGEPVHRVRVGAWAQRDEALSAAPALEARLGLGGGVSLRRAAGSAPAGAEPAFGWWVQAGVFSQQANAENLQERLRSAGFVARAEPLRLASGRHYRVRVGPHLDRAEAEAAKARLAAEFGIQGLVVSER